MDQPSIPHPTREEYASFYAGYVAAVSDADVLAVLGRQGAELSAMCAVITDADALFRYAAGKWSIKEVIGHLCDSERIFAYRALRIAREDPTPLAGFDENAYVAAAGFDHRSLEDLLKEMTVVRASTLSLLRSIESDAWERRGSANGADVSLRALAYIIAGHTRHHTRILADRYGLASVRQPEA